MKVTALPVKQKNKKARIIELLSSGNQSAQEIAMTVGTTPANVWKEKSRLKSRGLLLSRRTVEQSTKKTNDETILVSADERRSRSDNNYYRFLNLPQLDTNAVKKLYDEFRTGKKPIDIIADNGFHPEVVANEYKRYMKFRKRDIDILQERYISSIIKYPIAKAEPLIKKYQSKGYLTNNEFLELLKLKSEYDKDRGTWEKSREGVEYDDNTIFDKVRSILEESRPTSFEQGED
jgi:biotin operon repressor